MTDAQPTADARNVPVPQAAAQIGISRRLFEKHVVAGNIRVLRFGRRVLVPASEVARVAASGLPALPRTGGK